MRTLIFSLVVTLAGCDLYYGIDSQGSHGKKFGPDANPCCTIDSGVYPDAAVEPDAGSCHGGHDGGVFPDAGVYPDASVILPDAASYPDAAHH